MKKFAVQPELIKMVNSDLIRNVIKKDGPITKPNIAKITKLSLPTVNKIVYSLLKQNIIKECGIGESSGGRKPQLYEINAKAGYIISLYFKNDNYICTISNLLGEVIYDCNKEIDTSAGDKALSDTLDIIEFLIHIVKGDVKAIGIGVPGVVDNDNRITNIPSISGWEEINLKKIIEKKFKVKTFIENDVKLTTMGIFFNIFNMKYKNISYMYFGKGIGSGTIVNSKLLKGSNGFSGEISNMIIGYPEEEKVSDYTKVSLFEQKVLEVIKDIKKCTDKDELITKNNELARIISYCIVNIICIINPEIVVLSGDFINENLIKSIENNIKRFISKDNMPVIMILENPEKLGVGGVISLCMNGITSNIELVDNKGV